MPERLKLAVLLSGRGSNLAALIAASGRDLPIDIVAAFSDRADAPGLGLARAAGIHTASFDPKSFADKAAFESALFQAISDSGAELVVLAGFMRVISAATVARWYGRLINIHPSLLPKYQGLSTHARVLAAGESEHGASVHWVSAVLDGGPILMQVHLPTRPDDTPETLAARLLPEEHRLLIASVRLFAQRRVSLQDQDVVVDGLPLALPLRLN